MFIKDPIFEEFIKSKKWKELYNLKALETVAAGISAIIITILCSYIFIYSPIDDINSLLRSISKDIAIALFGLMGFLITGLAILLSGISSKVMNIIIKRGKEESINKIFLGFYFEGLLIGILIVALFILYIISFLDIELNAIFSNLMIFMFSYLVVFTIFYSVGLIGNCISIFRIVNNYSDEKDKEDKGDKEDSENCILNEKDKLVFNELKIMALENILIINSKNIEEEKRFIEFVKLLEFFINETISDELMKKRILTYFNSVYK